MRYNWEKYDSDKWMNSLSLGGTLKWDFGHFFIYSSMSWRNHRYTPISTTKYKNPTEAHVQIAWQINKNLYASLGLPYFWGVKKDIVSTYGNGYSKTIENRYRGMSLRPWILISWTLRKNSRQAIENKLPDF